LVPGSYSKNACKEKGKKKESNEKKKKIKNDKTGFQREALQ